MFSQPAQFDYLCAREWNILFCAGARFDCAPALSWLDYYVWVQLCSISYFLLRFSLSLCTGLFDTLSCFHLLALDWQQKSCGTATLKQQQQQQAQTTFQISFGFRSSQMLAAASGAFNYCSSSSYGWLFPRLYSFFLILQRSLFHAPFLGRFYDVVHTTKSRVSCDDNSFSLS